MNTVAMIGRFVAAPELRATTTGKFVTGFTLAVDDGWGDNKKTHFPEFVAWNKTAEAIAQHFTKGSRIAVLGRLTTRTWEDKDGNKRKTTEVVVESFDFLDSKKNDGPNVDPFSRESSAVNIPDDDLPFAPHKI